MKIPHYNVNAKEQVGTYLRDVSLLCASEMRTYFQSYTRSYLKFLFLVLCCLALPVLAASDATTDTKQETVTQGPVTLTLSLVPGRVFLNQDILLTIRATIPENISVVLPPIDNRLQGFLNSASFDREPLLDNGNITLERVIRLTPLIADEYRIAPMAMTYTDRSPAGTESGWLATPPIVLAMQAITDNDVGNDIKAHFNPVWIYPPMRTVAGYIAILIAVAALGFIIWTLLRRAHRKIRLMRMSPRDRALEELSELLAKKLIDKNQVKDFYVELTMVVRRYIERQHHIRAPEQTTEEFLAAVSSDPRFDDAVMLRLQRFLQAADLVKFAAYQPDQDNIRGSIDTAKDYITTDADQSEATDGIATGTEHKQKLL